MLLTHCYIDQRASGWLSAAVQTCSRQQLAQTRVADAADEDHG